MFKIIRETHLEKVTIAKLYKMYKNEEIDDEPRYQRYSDLWPTEKKRLLIDTIINGYDIPKFYFHYILSSSNALNNTTKQYAIIDGKQRITALLEFLNNEFELDKSVKFLERPDLNLDKLKYKNLSSTSELWEIKEKIDNFQLDIIHISTDENDRVEEMFMRLNEGVPVNNAEKRNSIGGFLIDEVNRYVRSSEFFTKKVKFGNKRMEHQDLLLKLSLIEDTEKIESFTKKNLDNLVKKFKPKKSFSHIEKDLLKNEAKILLGKVDVRLSQLSSVFSENDEMLRYKGILPLYYLFLRHNQSVKSDEFRRFIEAFDSARSQNRKIGKNIKPNTTMLQFDRLNQQGAHQSKSLATRLKILNFYFPKWRSGFDREMPFSEIGIQIEEDTI